MIPGYVARTAPRIGVIGESGSGKSTLLLLIILDYLAERPDVRFIVWDYANEFAGIEHENLFVFPADEWNAAEVAAIALELGDCVLVLDELTQAVNSHAGGFTDLGSPLREVFYRGRHRGVTVLYGAQRLNEVPLGARSNTLRFLFCRITDPYDLALTRERIRGKRGAQLFDQLPVLATGEFRSVLSRGE